jgi:hypothetical protein
MTPEDAKEIAETVALICAGCFFIIKVVAGYLYTNLSVSIATARSHLTPNNDLLIITAKLKKGGMNSIVLHDAMAKVIYYDVENKSHEIPPVHFIGIYRQSFNKLNKPLDYTDHNNINWNMYSKSIPLLRLTPEEEWGFSCHVLVPRTVVCTVEVAVLGRSLSIPTCRNKMSQWKASHVSAPNSIA